MLHGPAHATRVNEIGVMRLLSAIAVATSMFALTVALIAIVARRDATPDPMHALGMTLAPGRDRGVVVNSLRSDGAARWAGLQVGDRIRAIDGHGVRSVGDVDRDLADHAIAVFTIDRAGRTNRIELAVR